MKQEDLEEYQKRLAKHLGGLVGFSDEEILKLIQEIKIGE
jgi:hypothetical protein